GGGRTRVLPAHAGTARHFSELRCMGCRFKCCDPPPQSEPRYAEGCCRKCDSELGRFLQIAMGSASELEYHLLLALARDLDFLNSPDYQRLELEVVEVKRMLSSLIRKLRAAS